MISGLFLVNLKGEIVICRYYRDDVSRTAVDAWCSTVVAAKEGGTRPPVTMIEDGTSSGPTFIHTRHANMYFMACTRHNLNPSLVLQYLFQLVAILKPTSSASIASAGDAATFSGMLLGSPILKQRGARCAGVVKHRTPALVG